MSARDTGKASAVLTVSRRKSISLSSGLGMSGDRSGGVDVGQPEVHAAELLGQREDEAACRTGDPDGQCAGGISEGRRVEDEVRAAAGPDAPASTQSGGPHPVALITERAAMANFRGPTPRRARRPRRRRRGARTRVKIAARTGGGPRDRSDQPRRRSTARRSSTPCPAARAGGRSAGGDHIDRRQPLRPGRTSGVPAARRSASPARNPARTRRSALVSP